MKKSMKHRRYTIGPAPGRPFHVGRTPDGGQLILGLMFSEMIAYVFDSDGHLVSRERETWRKPEMVRNGTGVYWLYEPGTRSEVERKVVDWMRELRVTEEAILINAFFDAEYNVGIEDVPQCLESPIKGETDNERRERDVERIGWIQSGKFIFWWELDYWMASDGT
ncbi:hypothetical protein [Pseudoxanthomonas sp. UTMC 1351]|uniref:hypothetical protein n=1 Tax=Pseudoxanthomonas sp. UTMC 1351 TaxID=2695853 RepID=UPI0034CFBF99